MKIGIDLGGSHIGIGLVDEKGKIVEKKEIDLKQKENFDMVRFYRSIYITSSGRNA